MMDPVLLTLAISGGTFAFLSLLFYIEKRRGRRFFPRMRSGFDALVVAFYSLADRATRLFGRETVRHTIHYLFHRLLQLFRAIFRALEQKTDALLRANKELAKRAQTREAARRSKLDEVAEHKADTALSPKERKVRKEKSIGTKL